MSTFKVGDIVTAIDDRYRVTSATHGWVGRIIRLRSRTFDAETICWLSSIRDIAAPGELLKKGHVFRDLDYSSFALYENDLEVNENMRFKKYDNVQWGYSRNIETIRAFYGELLNDDGSTIGYVASNFRNDNKTPCFNRSDDYINQNGIYTVSNKYIGTYVMYDDEMHSDVYNYLKNADGYYGFINEMKEVLSKYFVKDITDEEMLKLLALITYFMDVDWKPYISKLGVVQCADCGKYDIVSNMNLVYDKYYCDSCKSKLATCKHCGSIITDSYHGYCLECANEQGEPFVYDYHSFDNDCYNPRGDKGNCYMGIELEYNTSCDYPYIGADYINKLDKKDLFHFETDSSITGFEMISQPCTLEYWKENRDYLQSILDAVRDSYKEIGDNTGFHVHINTKAFKNARAVTRFVTINSFYEKCLINIARRKPTRYCEFRKVPLADYDRYIKDSMEYFAGHNTFINLHTSSYNRIMSTKTIEVRYFKSTFSADEVIETLSILEKMVDLANDGKTVYPDSLFKDVRDLKSIPFDVWDRNEKRNRIYKIKSSWFYNNYTQIVVGANLYRVVGYDAEKDVIILANKLEYPDSASKEKFRYYARNISDLLINKRRFYKEGCTWNFIEVSPSAVSISNVFSNKAIELSII